MKRLDNKLMNYLLDKKLTSWLFMGEFGLEKENIRVDEDGRLALTPHPPAFGDKLKNPYITTDFSESQIEMITPVCNSIADVYNFLENLQNIVSLNLNNEYLWPQSNPPVLPDDEVIPIADFGSDGQEHNQYRRKLVKKYGKKKQLLSGIHLNFSFGEELMQLLFKHFNQKMTYRDFKDYIYLKIAASFLKFRWLLIYLTAASPVIHQTFYENYPGFCRVVDDESLYCPNLCSLRNSPCGYKNAEDYVIRYDSIENYTSDIQALTDMGKIIDYREFYCPVRLKAGHKPGGLNHLRDKGIRYLELRIFDLNPFSKIGIKIEDLHLVHLFLIYFLVKQPDDFTAEQQRIANMNHELATMAGVCEDDKIYDEYGRLVFFRDEALTILDDLSELVELLDVNKIYLNNIIHSAKEKVLQPEKTYASMLVEAVKKHTYIGFHMQLAKDYLHHSKPKEARFIGYEDLELSTQILIRDAVKRGINFTILDRKENFIKLENGVRTEYVKQATKTSLDSYITVLIMENKLVTKAVLEERGFKVPAGHNFDQPVAAKKAYLQFKDKKIVVKPNRTNFGLGISIFKDTFSEEDYKQAVDIAFSYDSTVLVEEFVHGREYRFLVMGNEVVGILLRVPANVKGDGKKTIRELVQEKNLDPLRGKGYKTPLEKISLGEIEEVYLKNQGRTFDDVPKKDEIVYLRENSNISTGGDSLDYTELVHDSYKVFAVGAAQCVGAAITGIDMMIEDVNQPQNKNNCTIIEMNFNPAIHIHCYPYKGKNRRAGDKILDLLFNREGC